MSFRVSINILFVVQNDTFLAFIKFNKHVVLVGCIQVNHDTQS